MPADLLSDPQIKHAKGGEKPYKLTDGRGKFLHVQPSGTKYWRLRYKIWGQERKMARTGEAAAWRRSARARSL